MLYPFEQSTQLHPVCGAQPSACPATHKPWWCNGLGVAGNQQHIGGLLRPTAQGCFCSNVLIADCTFTRNFRQGISVTGGVNCLIEDCVMAQTFGIDPMSGIDGNLPGFLCLMSRKLKLIVAVLVCSRAEHPARPGPERHLQPLLRPEQRRLRDCRRVSPLRAATQDAGWLPMAEPF